MNKFWIVVLLATFAWTSLAFAQNTSSEKTKLDLVISKIMTSEDLGQLAAQCPADYYNGKNVEYSSADDTCTTNPKKCLQKCLNGDANKCFGLGYAIQQLSEDSNEMTERLYAKSCQLGLPLACTNRSAGILANGLNLDDAEVCIARTFKMTCEVNDQWGCQMYALVVWNGVGVEKDAKFAKELVKKTCALDPEHTPCDYAKSILAEINNAEKVPDPK